MDRLLFTLSFFLIPSTKGAIFLPTVYTLPDGLESVNGSSSTGGCPGTCLKNLITGTTINGCDCEGSLSSPARGFLIDNIIPNIDTTQRGIWANELFVVNRNHQNSFQIGFEFNTNFYLRSLEVTYLDCQIWGAGMSSINVYSSYVFPTFGSPASTRIGELSFTDDTSQSCTSLTTASISVQPRESSSYFYVEFSFVGGSSTHPLNWVHLAEIKFSDVDPPIMVSTLTTNEGSEQLSPNIMSLVANEVEESFNTFQDLQTANDPTTECSLICIPTTDEHFLTTHPITSVQPSSTIILSASYGHVTSSVKLQQSKFGTRYPKSTSDHNNIILPAKTKTVQSFSTIIPSALTLSYSSFQDFQTTAVDQMGECRFTCRHVPNTTKPVTAQIVNTKINVSTFSGKSLTTSGSINPTTFSVTILGTLVGVIVFLTAMLIIICASFIVCFIIYSRHNVKKLRSLDSRYVVIGNPNSGSTHELKPTESRRSSTALNSLYQLSTVTSLSSTSALSPMVQPENQGQTDNVLYSEIGDVWVIGNTETDNSEDCDECSGSNENHYAMIPELYTLATIIPKSKPESEVEVEHIPASNQEGNGTFEADNKGYTLVRKHLLPPVPEKCSELQQYLELKDTLPKARDMHLAECKADSKVDKYQYSDSEVEATAQEINEQSHCPQGESTDCEPQITDPEGSNDGYVGNVKDSDEVIASE